MTEPAPVLHVYLLNDEEWWVAESEADCWRLITEFTGIRPDDDSAPHTLEVMADDFGIRICVNDAGEIADEDDWHGARLTLTAREWADREGPGMLAAEHY